MKNIYIKETDAIDYVTDYLNKAKCECSDIQGAKYHHNTKYHYTSSIIENGILHLRELKNIGIKDYSEEFLTIMDDSLSHINGADGISLSIPNLPDLSRNEEEYDPFSSCKVDILIDGSIKAFRNSTNYGNEFICFDIIEPVNFKTIDIRLLKYISEVLKNGRLNRNEIEIIIKKFNSLINISKSINNQNLNIPIREMSFDEFEIDKNKLINGPKLILK